MSQASPRLRFVPLAENHLDLILHWLKEPHVKPFWTESADPEEVRAKFRGKAAKRIFGFVVEQLVEQLDEPSGSGAARPIAYIQHYEAWNVGPGWWPDARPGVYGLDLMVGPPDLVGKGLGTEIVDRFISEILRPGREVIEVIADPDPANLSAIRAFEKCGFRRQGLVPTPYGEALLFKLTCSLTS